MMNGDIWIIEAKGGIDEHGDSNNIDSYAKNKFDALKEYAKRHENIKWGFARAVGQFIYFQTLTGMKMYIIMLFGKILMIL